MPRLLNILTSKPNCGPVWVAFVLLGISALNSQAKIVLTVPQQVSLSANFFSQQLTISWFGGEATTFDLIILRTEFNETVFYNTVPAVMNQDGGRHQWTWTSVEPLECTSLSVKIRSRDGITKSEWSEPQILKGRDLPSNSVQQVYPQDKVVPVGGNTTFCCIVEEGNEFRDFLYGSIEMNVKRLSRRSYATTAVNQNLSGPTGTNVLCRLKNKLNGSVIFVGYPPLPTNFECITNDLTSAVCYWDGGRVTNLYGKRKTSYSINKRDCPDGKCVLPEWDGNWTLLAVNPLGQYSLTYSAELLHRVVPVAPDKLNATDDAWNATVKWHWPYSSYSTLALLCQVQLLRNFSGVGLHSVFLPHLHPNTKYRVRVHCGSLNHFLKWGNWSKEFHFTTKSYVPEAPDVWMFVNRDNSVRVMWKPLTRWQSHGVLTGYEVTLWNLEENENQTNNLSPKDNSLNLTDWASITADKKAIASVKANNVKGMSQPSTCVLWTCAPLAQTIYTSSGFPLSWQHSDNSTGGYLVEWCEAVCTSDCAVDWIRLDAGSTHVSIKDSIVKFQPGVRYNFSLYESPSVSPVLIRRWQGYIQELPPSISVNLEINQQDCDVVLSWEEIPLAGRRGFLLGYKVYRVNNFSNFTLLADGLILEILTSLGIVTLLLTTVSCFCYKKRRCMVHIIEKPKWDFSKDALVIIPEEEDYEGEGIGDEPVDTDEPQLLRYYNQVVDERPIRPRFPDSSVSSSSSVDSANTDVTYTGIQTSHSSLVFPSDSQGFSEGFQPHSGLSLSSRNKGEGYHPQMHSVTLGGNLASPEPIVEPHAVGSEGYKPQNSWLLDSPTEGDENSPAPSLGSPASVASTQFLLPDRERHEEKRQQPSSAANWFTNLLSSAKP
uniref:Fibronectin type-III domain-containing protein n=1 Tax=Xiphophorus couchianus TaxID=32473 RepID=A0A3B5LL08_9TELE